jgi:hypothetical protein
MSEAHPPTLVEAGNVAAFKNNWGPHLAAIPFQQSERRRHGDTHSMLKRQRSG